MGKSIVIVQTSQVSSTELKTLCSEIIPDVAVRQIIDDSLLDEVTTNGGVTKAVIRRMYSHYAQAASLGCDLILNQCSSVGEVADLMRRMFDIPIVKIDEAMARKAVRLGTRIAVIATTPTTVGPSVRLVEHMADEIGKRVEIDQRLVDGAMMVLIKTGNRELHNRMVIDEIVSAAKVNDVVVLAQGSMTAVEPLLTGIDKPVLTSRGWESNM